MLQNEVLDVKKLVDTAENEPKQLLRNLKSEQPEQFVQVVQFAPYETLCPRARRERRVCTSSVLGLQGPKQFFAAGTP